MNSPEDTPPIFENDHDALVFLIEKYNFEGGWIGPAGMGFDGDVEIDASAPKWARDMAFTFVLDLHCADHPVLMAMEHVDCQFSREDSRLILSRHWSSPLMAEGPCVLQPRVLQEAITSILGIKSCAPGDDVDSSLLIWTGDSDIGQFSCDTEDFVLYDSEFEDITCDKDQALKILEALRKPGMTEDKYWSSFNWIGSIHLEFSGLDGDYHYGFTGGTEPEDITEACLKSQRNCRP